MTRTQRLLRFPLTRLVIAGVALVVLLQLGALVIAPSVSRLVWTLATAAIALLVHLLVGVRIEGRTREELGLDSAPAGLDMASGTMAGALLMAAIVGMLAIPGWYRVLGLEGRWLSLAHSLLLLLFAAGMEELVFRGMLFRILEEWLGSWLALLASGLLFGMAHLSNPAASAQAALAIALEAGVLLGAAYMVTRSLWLPWGLHWGWNAAQGPIFGLPVSGLGFDGLVKSELVGPPLWTGGGFGPEAGLAAMLAGAAASALALAIAWRRGRFISPGWLRRGRPPAG